MKYKLQCIMCGSIKYIKEDYFSNEDIYCDYCGEELPLPDELIDKIDFNKIEE